MKIAIIYEVGDMVSLPLCQTGNIVKILPIPWGYKYKVRLHKANAAFGYKTNEIHPYKYEDLKPL